MGMLIDGIWEAYTDRFMKDGAFLRETSPMPSRLDAETCAALREDPARFVLTASYSCPWSHATVLAAALKGWQGRLPIQRAGGARIEGYALLPQGPLAEEGVRHMHQLYTRTDPYFTGRATVPVLWDTAQKRIVSNASSDIIHALDLAGAGPSLAPDALRTDIEALTDTIFNGLSNAVYRAGLAERQEAYQAAVNSVFDTLDMLEDRLAEQPFLFGPALTTADLRLFATLVRFDTVYATHFRCTRKRLVDYSALWRFTRRLYQSPGIRETVDFEDIRAGYYLNDGAHNPFGILPEQPIIDWDDKTGLHSVLHFA